MVMVPVPSVTAPATTAAPAGALTIGLATLLEDLDLPVGQRFTIGADGVSAGSAGPPTVPASGANRLRDTTGSARVHAPRAALGAVPT